MTGTMIRTNEEPQDGRHEESGEDEDDPSTGRLGAGYPRGAAPNRPSGVWFGSKRSESEDRHLIAFLGTHNGAAVLQWPGDADRAAKLFSLGIPYLWFVQNAADVPPLRSGSEGWLLRTASDPEIQQRLEELCRCAAAERAAEPLVLEDTGWLHFGIHGIELMPPDPYLAAALMARFGEVVEDTALTEALACGLRTPHHCSLDGQLRHLDQEVNALGLEVVRGGEHAHVIRRCWS
jgi:hypothetical protein